MAAPFKFPSPLSSQRMNVERYAIVLNAVEQIGCESLDIAMNDNCSECCLVDTFTCRCCQISNRLRGDRCFCLRRVDRFGIIPSRGHQFGISEAFVNPLNARTASEFNVFEECSGNADKTPASQCSVLRGG